MSWKMNISLLRGGILDNVKIFRTIIKFWLKSYYGPGNILDTSVSKDTVIILEHILIQRGNEKVKYK